MNGDVRERFQLAGTADRLQLASDPQSREELRAWLGDALVDAYVQMAATLPTRPTLEGHPPNLVFVPGVMGSVLVSQGLGGVWWLDVRTRHRLDSLGLSEDGTADATAGARISAAAVDSSYDAFCTAALARHDIGHLTFPYDWRRPIPAVAGGLRDLIVRTFEANGRLPVHLVAHSMGGLVIREALRQYPELWDRVGRIAFLGTPHYGSPAIAGYLKNHLWGMELLALLGHYLTRPTFRSLWGVLDLLPAPEGVYPGTRAGAADPQPHPCANFELYDAAAYQLALDHVELERLQRVLDDANKFHTTLAAWHQNLPQEKRDRMLVIAGVGFQTLFRLAYRPAFGFLWEHMHRVTGRAPGDPNREGDGRVPLASAQLEFVGDIRYARAEHGRLPAVPAIQADVFRWLQGEPMSLPTTPAAALSAVLGDLAGGPAPGTSGDDPGYLDLEGPNERRLMEYEASAAADRLPGFEQVKLL